MKKTLPIGIQDFRKIINGGHLYVDKTEIIHRLITEGGYYFLSRPRRFGKSLLVSTLKEIFLGNSELFKNLWIYDKIEWDQYPVIHIDFSNIDYKHNRLDVALENEINIIANTYSIKYEEKSLKEKFRELIRKLSSTNKVVLLIDEYDKSIIDYIDDIPKAKENKEILKNFYSVIKPMDQYLKFVFLTGVSKFSKVSIFSDLNNLADITISENYATLCGLTKEEIANNFKDYFQPLQTKYNVSKEKLMNDMKEWYDGYSWDGAQFVYNPFSLLNFFQNRKFGNYWFATGTPTFLVKKIKEQNIRLENFDVKIVPEAFFDKFELEDMDLFSLLFQTGYLTIKETILQKRGNLRYVLSYPNNEVREAFLYNLIEQYSYKKISGIGEILWKIEEMLEKKEIEGFINSLKPLFSSIPYNIFEANLESYYHSIIYVALSLIGFDIDCEVQTNTGRIDAIIKTEKYIYIIEFKLGEAKSAMAQIKEKEYYSPYLNSEKEIVLLGVGFDTEMKNIGNWIEETILNGEL